MRFCARCGLEIALRISSPLHHLPHNGRFPHHFLVPDPLTHPSCEIAADSRALLTSAGDLAIIAERTTRVCGCTRNWTHSGAIHDPRCRCIFCTSGRGGRTLKAMSVDDLSSSGAQPRTPPASLMPARMAGTVFGVAGCVVGGLAGHCLFFAMARRGYYMVADPSLSCYLAHLSRLNRITLVAIGAGAAIAFWFGVGRARGVWPGSMLVSRVDGKDINEPSTSPRQGDPRAV